MEITKLKVNEIDQFYNEIERENISTYGDLCNKVNKNRTIPYKFLPFVC